MLGTIDLADWEPGPIEVEITPDGKTAVVSIGPAFFDDLPGLVGDPEIPEGGTLLIVDLESGVADEVQTKSVPLGIAISPDGMTAYTANYGTGVARGSSLSDLRRSRHDERSARNRFRSVRCLVPRW